jgi:hypothetical protein
VTLLGIVILYPRVSITPGENWSSSDPLLVPLKVSNDGQFSIYSSRLECQIDYVTNYDNGKGMEGFTTNVADFPIGDLEGGGYSMGFCTLPSTTFMMMTPGQRVEAHIILHTTFRPSFWPSTISRDFNLRGVTDSDKKFHWILTSR